MASINARLVLTKVLHAETPFSMREQLAEVTDFDQAESVKRRLAVLYAIYRFAPEFRLHPNDIYRPTSVPWYLQVARMRRHRAGWFDKPVLNIDEVTVNSLVSQTSGGQNSGIGRAKTDFFLELAIDIQRVRRGLLAVAKCYVHFRPAPDSAAAWDIQYWVFYAYNGDITRGADFEHEGDWEHVTVRVQPDLGAILQVFYHAHNNESEWREPEQFQANDEGHPIVYSANRSHATYWRAGTQSRSLLPDDHTAEGGPIWQTWDSLQLVGERERPHRGQGWINYTGHWGQIGTKIAWLSGPWGPAFQRYWDKDT